MRERAPLIETFDDQVAPITGACCAWKHGVLGLAWGAALVVDGATPWPDSTRPPKTSFQFEIAIDPGDGYGGATRHFPQARRSPSS